MFPVVLNGILKICKKYVQNFNFFNFDNFPKLMYFLQVVFNNFKKCLQNVR